MISRLDLVAGLGQGDQARQVGLGVDRLAVDRDDHVAARVDRPGPGTDLGVVAGLEARLVGRAAVDHLGDERPGVDVRGRACPRAAGRAASWSPRRRRRRPRRRRAAGRASAARGRSGPRSRPLVAARGGVDLLVDADDLPSASSSGPPELPGLTRRSGSRRRSGTSQRLDRAVGGGDDPTESDCSWPNGLPIAATPSPTSTSFSEPSGSGWMSRPPGRPDQRDVGEGVEADDLGLDLVAVGELDVDLARLVQRAALRAAASASVTTWALVRISPSSEMTNPEPWPWPPPPPKRSGVPPPPITERIVTTPRRRSRRSSARRRRRPRPRSRPAWRRPARQSWTSGRRATDSSSPQAAIATEAAAIRVTAAIRARRISAGPRRGGGRKPQLELRPPAPRAQLERAVHAPRELAGDREAEPGAADVVARVEALEDALARAGSIPGPSSATTRLAEPLSI